MEKIFFDTDVVLDLVLDRDDADCAGRILEYSKTDGFTRVYISYLTVADTAFVLRKRTASEIRDALKSILRLMFVIPSDDMQILGAMKCGSPDFEDALQIACAESKDCDVIVTRNPDHFRDYTEIPVLSPKDFVRRSGAAERK